MGKVSKKMQRTSRVNLPRALENDFDAVLIAGGAEQPRDLPVPGRQLSGVTLLWTFFLCKI